MNYKKLFILLLILPIILLSMPGCDSSQEPESTPTMPPESTPAEPSPESPSTQNPPVTASPNITIPSPSVLTPPDPLTEFVVKSDLIVLGTITDLRYEVVNVGQGEWAGKFAYTIFTLSVEKVIKGGPVTNEVLIKVEGGVIDDEVMQGPTGGYFSISERALVCLNRVEGNVYTLFPLFPFGLIWCEVKNSEIPPVIFAWGGLQESIGWIIRIMKDNNIPIALPGSEWPPIPAPSPVSPPK